MIAALKRIFSRDHGENAPRRYSRSSVEHGAEWPNGKPPSESWDWDSPLHVEIGWPTKGSTWRPNPNNLPDFRQFKTMAAQWSPEVVDHACTHRSCDMPAVMWTGSGNLSFLCGDHARELEHAIRACNYEKVIDLMTVEMVG